MLIHQAESNRISKYCGITSMKTVKFQVLTEEKDFPVIHLLIRQENSAGPSRFTGRETQLPLLRSTGICRFICNRT